MRVADLLLAPLNSLIDWFGLTFGSELSTLQEYDIITKLLAATVCGALLGFEREYAKKAAGLRTNIFICVGSALFTLASIIAWQTLTGGTPPSDPMRVAAQIVTGVGFLGAGVIFKTEEQITGITTAATIWFVAAVGMLIGIGFPFLGFLIALVATGILFALGRLEEKVFPYLHKETPPD